MNTIEYAQPEQYHFCQDSVLFPRWIASQLKDQVIENDYRALDLCSGCGVIGFELCFLEPRLKFFDFIEIQTTFSPYWQKNCVQFPERKLQFHEMNYDSLKHPEWSARYDLIVGNPPSFEKTEGKLSPSELNNRCRFFIDSSLESLLIATTNALKKNGQGFLLVKDGGKHGRQTLRSARLLLADTANVDITGEIRGTKVFRLLKK